MDEQRFTLDEARKVIARQACAMQGHDFEVLTELGGGPRTVFCRRCGLSWPVATSENQSETPDA